MKNIVVLFTAVTAMTLLTSCGNKSTKNQSAGNCSVVEKDTVSALTDSMICELKMAHKRSMELYSDEQFYKFAEYVYPQLFKYLKDKSHSASVETEKDKFVDMLITRNDNYWEKTVPTISPNAISYSFAFKDIEFYRKSGSNLFVIYRQQAFYITQSDTIISPDFSYGYAIFLAKYNKWYFLDFKTKDIATILKGDFCQTTIKEIAEETKRLY